MAVKNIITIGRSVESDYRVNSESVSNEHAMLKVSDSEKCLLIDCGSTNGTRLPLQSGADRISQSEVSLDSSVFFGDHEQRVGDIVASRRSVRPPTHRNEHTRFRDPVDGSIKKGPRS